MNRRVGLADIAREVGVAKSTVSLALRGDPRVIAGTAARIKSVAKSLGYRPSPILASLARRNFSSSGKKGGVPLAFLHFPIDPEQMSPVERMTAERHEYATRLGYFLEEFDISSFKDGAHLSRVLIARGVQGILLPQLFRAELMEGFDWKSFAAVGVGENWIGPALPRPSINRAAMDHFHLVAHAWNETWSRGYRRIGFILFRHSEPGADDEARLGAAEACRHRVSRGLQIPPLELVPEGAGVEEKILRWARQNRPEAIIGFNGWFLGILQRGGFRIPEDIGFVTLHTSGIRPPPGSPWIAISGMKEMELELNHAAIELLDQQLRHHHYGLDPRARTLLVPSEWVEGDTLPPRKAG